MKIFKCILFLIVLIIVLFPDPGVAQQESGKLPVYKAEDLHLHMSNLKSISIELINYDADSTGVYIKRDDEKFYMTFSHAFINGKPGSIVTWDYFEPRGVSTDRMYIYEDFVPYNRTLNLSSLKDIRALYYFEKKIYRSILGEDGSVKTDTVKLSPEYYGPGPDLSTFMFMFAALDLPRYKNKPFRLYTANRLPFEIKVKDRVTYKRIEGPNIENVWEIETKVTKKDHPLYQHIWRYYVKREPPYYIGFESFQPGKNGGYQPGIKTDYVDHYFLRSLTSEEMDQFLTESE